MRDGVTTADNGVTKMQTVGTEKRNKCSANSSSSQSTLSATDVGTNEIGEFDESVFEDAEMSWIFVVADAVAINQLSMDDAHS